jgi:phosphate/sulfate permease
VIGAAGPQGFGSETVAASVILASSHVGFPLSTTQVVSGAVAGSGVGRPGALVNWRVAGNIVVGWLFTLPAAGAAALWRATRAKPTEPHDAVSERPAFGPAAQPVTA